MLLIQLEAKVREQRRKVHREGLLLGYVFYLSCLLDTIKQPLSKGIKTKLM